VKRTIDSWLRLFDEERRQSLPTFHLSLMLDENGMQLYPNCDDLLPVVAHVVDEAANTFQMVRRSLQRLRFDGRSTRVRLPIIQRSLSAQSSNTCR